MKERLVQPELLDHLPSNDPRAIGSRTDLRRVNWFMRNGRILVEALRESSPGAHKRRVLELGAGDGTLLLRLARELGPDWRETEAVLLDRQNIVGPATLRAFGDVGWSVKLLEADVFETLKAEGSHYDVIVTNLFLHHFSDEQLKKLFSLVADKAKAFVAVEPHRDLCSLFFSRLVGLLGANSVTRHDAVVSVRAGFAFRELSRFWPDAENWSVTERKAGAFSHLFSARSRDNRHSVALSASRSGGPARKPITIVGGGLAGLTLGIGLRQRGIPVTVWEAGTYPRHRVCGEFISGRGQDALRRLGVLEPLIAAGAIPACSAAFFNQYTASPIRHLPNSAYCISRFTLDQLMAQRFLELGGCLNQDHRLRGETEAEGLVFATGRRPQPTENGWRWFGLKAHARNIQLHADLEMHALPSGYVGLCRLKGDEVNVCGLFRKKAGADSSFSWQEMLHGPSESILHSRLAEAVFDESSFCSVAGLSLYPRRAVDHVECCVGDALTMTPPVTGNG
ncbi:MAG TPA: FAD-dependent monooxygenase, partial [Candidatus Dormibacteraeota bacterium]|nr:FAD-dependent monooxygenase [Candidatus Dormibacteraeota bacterium]